MLHHHKIAVILPCYNVKNQILDVLRRIPKFVDTIYVVDDACPQNTAAHIRKNNKDKRVRVLSLPQNKGVGGATMAGMSRAVQEGADIVVKIDGDGQHEPEMLEAFLLPLCDGSADFAKGNRFFFLENLRQMPKLRLLGNAILSFISKFSSGYWNVFDPTNGYIAMHSEVFKALPLEKIHQRYFFESDLLFRLYTIEAKITEIPMNAIYQGESSALQPSKIVGLFFWGHIKNAVKRIFYSYFLRNFSIVSIYLIFGFLFLLFGLITGGATWLEYLGSERGAPFGMVLFPSVMILIGMQMLLGFFSNDIASVPNRPVHPLLKIINRARPKKKK